MVVHNLLIRWAISWGGGIAKALGPSDFHNTILLQNFQSANWINFILPGFLTPLSLQIALCPNEPANSNVKTGPSGDLEKDAA